MSVTLCLSPRRLEKVFNFTKEDFQPKTTPQPGGYSLFISVWMPVSDAPGDERNLFCFPESVHVSGEQRLKMAQQRAQEKQSSLQKDLDAKRGAVHIKQEPVREDEPMDTSSHPSSSIPNGSVNGHPSASPAFDHTNGNGGTASTPSPELQDFVLKTFRKHFVLTLNELKRLFSLHLASMQEVNSVFHSISDHMLQDAVLLSRCKQILVPVSMDADDPQSQRETLRFQVARWTSG